MAPGGHGGAWSSGRRLLVAAALLTSLAASGLAAAGSTPVSAPGSPSGYASLRVETGTHGATIRAIAADRDGRYAVTAAEDKTARVWDIDTGRLLQVFRPPSSPGSAGKLFAVSMAADGKLFATAGWSAANDVYLVSRTSAAIIHRITGLPNVITALAFSPDGRLLVVGLWGEKGIRVFASSDGWTSSKEVGGDSDIAGDVHALAWSADGRRLAASSADGALRLYEASAAGLKRLQRKPAAGRDIPFGLAFSPDGKSIAVGAANSPQAAILDAAKLTPLATIAADGPVNSGGLSAVAWSGDGRRLFAAGSRHTESAEFPLCTWTPGMETCTANVALARNSVTMLVSIPGGRTLFATAEPSWGLLDDSGAVVRKSSAELADFRELRSQFRVAGDGQAIVAFPAATSRGVDKLPAFDVKELSWRTPGRDWTEPKTRAVRTSVENWFEQNQPIIGGRRVRLEDNELSLTATVARKGDRIAIGTNFYIRCFDNAGHELWRTPAPGSAWQVNISADGRWVVAAFSDGTLRWFRSTDGSEQLALLPHPDRRRWVAWSPLGYFATSVGGEDLVGWQVDRGQGRSADFFPVSRFRADFYRPDFIAAVLAHGNAPGSATPPASRDQPKQALPVAVTEQLPPSVRIASPEDGKTIIEDHTTVSVSVQSTANAPIVRLRARVNGVVVALPEVAALRALAGPSGAEKVFELSVPLPDVDADIMIFAENRHGVSVPAVLRVLRAPKPITTDRPKTQRVEPSADNTPASSAAPLTTGDLRPALYVLAVGVGDYADRSIRLEYSAKDATDLSTLLKTQAGWLYRKVEVRLLTDRNARHDDVLDGLEWIRREMTARDVGMVFLAGHGVNDSDGTYYFLPHDTDVKRLKRTGVIFTEIRNTLVSLPGKALFFVDTCHSGNVLGTGLRSLQTDTTAIVNELSSAENGVIVFTATTGRQYAQESEDWRNGAFTRALVEGLGGKADMTKSGRVTHKMLDLYVSERVKHLTDGAQSPVTIAPSGVPDFPLTISPDGARLSR